MEVLFWQSTCGAVPQGISHLGLTKVTELPRTWVPDAATFVQELPEELLPLRKKERLYLKSLSQTIKQYKRGKMVFDSLNEIIQQMKRLEIVILRRRHPWRQGGSLLPEKEPWLRLGRVHRHSL